MCAPETHGRFAPALRRAERHLRLPQPTRSRVLREMASDLEDLYAAYLTRGLGPEEAQRRAEQALGAGREDTLGELSSLHAPLYERLLGRFSHRSRHRLERLLLTLMTACSVGTAVMLLGTYGSPAAASPFAWLILGAGGGAVALSASSAFRLLIKQDHRPARVRDGLGGLLWIACAVLLLAAFGSAWELYRTAASVQAAGAWSLELFLPRVRRAAEVVALGLSVHLSTLLCWFHLRRRALAVERAELETPFAPTPPGSPGVRGIARVPSRASISVSPAREAHHG